MEEIITPSKLTMQMPDQTAYYLGLIKTPEKINNNKIYSYIFIGVIGTIGLGLIGYYIYLINQENLKNKKDA